MTVFNTSQITTNSVPVQTRNSRYYVVPLGSNNTAIEQTKERIKNLAGIYQSIEILSKELNPPSFIDATAFKEDAIADDLSGSAIWKHMVLRTEDTLKAALLKAKEADFKAIDNHLKTLSVQIDNAVSTKFKDLQTQYAAAIKLKRANIPVWDYQKIAAMSGLTVDQIKSVITVFESNGPVPTALKEWDIQSLNALFVTINEHLNKIKEPSLWDKLINRMGPARAKVEVRPSVIPIARSVTPIPGAEIKDKDRLTVLQEFLPAQNNPQHSIIFAQVIKTVNDIILNLPSDEEGRYKAIWLAMKGVTPQSHMLHRSLEEKKLSSQSFLEAETAVERIFNAVKLRTVYQSLRNIVSPTDPIGTGILIDIPSGDSALKDYVLSEETDPTKLRRLLLVATSPDSNFEEDFSEITNYLQILYKSLLKKLQEKYSSLVERIKPDDEESLTALAKFHDDITHIEALAEAWEFITKEEGNAVPDADSNLITLAEHIDMLVFELKDKEKTVRLIELRSLRESLTEDEDNTVAVKAALSANEAELMQNLSHELQGNVILLKNILVNDGDIADFNPDITDADYKTILANFKTAIAKIQKDIKNTNRQTQIAALYKNLRARGVDVDAVCDLISRNEVEFLMSEDTEMSEEELEGVISTVSTALVSSAPIPATLNGSDLSVLQEENISDTDFNLLLESFTNLIRTAQIRALYDELVLHSDDANAFRTAFAAWITDNETEIEGSEAFIQALTSDEAPTSENINENILSLDNNNFKNLLIAIQDVVREYRSADNRIQPDLINQDRSQKIASLRVKLRADMNADDVIREFTDLETNQDLAEAVQLLIQNFKALIVGADEVELTDSELGFPTLSDNDFLRLYRIMDDVVVTARDGVINNQRLAAIQTAYHQLGGDLVSPESVLALLENWNPTNAPQIALKEAILNNPTERDTVLPEELKAPEITNEVFVNELNNFSNIVVINARRKAELNQLNDQLYEAEHFGAALKYFNDNLADISDRDQGYQDFFFAFVREINPQRENETLDTHLQAPDVSNDDFNGNIQYFRIFTRLAQIYTLRAYLQKTDVGVESDNAIANFADNPPNFTEDYNEEQVEMNAALRSLDDTFFLYRNFANFEHLMALNDTKFAEIINGYQVRVVDTRIQYGAGIPVYRATRINALRRKLLTEGEGAGEDARARLGNWAPADGLILQFRNMLIAGDVPENRDAANEAFREFDGLTAPQLNEYEFEGLYKIVDEKIILIKDEVAAEEAAAGLIAAPGAPLVGLGNSGKLANKVEQTTTTAQLLEIADNSYRIEPENAIRKEELLSLWKQVDILFAHTHTHFNVAEATADELPMETSELSHTGIQNALNILSNVIVEENEPDNLIDTLKLENQEFTSAEYQAAVKIIRNRLNLYIYHAPSTTFDDIKSINDARFVGIQSLRARLKNAEIKPSDVFYNPFPERPINRSHVVANQIMKLLSGRDSVTQIPASLKIDAAANPINRVDFQEAMDLILDRLRAAEQNEFNTGIQYYVNQLVALTRGADLSQVIDIDTDDLELTKNGTRVTQVTGNQLIAHMGDQLTQLNRIWLEIEKEARNTRQPNGQLTDAYSVAETQSKDSTSPMGQAVLRLDQMTAEYNKLNKNHKVNIVYIYNPTASGRIRAMYNENLDEVICSGPVFNCMAELVMAGASKAFRHGSVHFPNGAFGDKNGTTITISMDENGQYNEEGDSKFTVKFSTNCKKMVDIFEAFACAYEAAAGPKPGIDVQIRSLDIIFSRVFHNLLRIINELKENNGKPGKYNENITGQIIELEQQAWEILRTWHSLYPAVNEPAKMPLLCDLFKGDVAKQLDASSKTIFNALKDTLTSDVEGSKSIHKKCLEPREGSFGYGNRETKKITDMVKESRISAEHVRNLTHRGP